jgi:Pyridoxamine 5'-phosphate oxidase
VKSILVDKKEDSNSYQEFKKLYRLVYNNNNRFLMQGTFTGKLAIVKKDGSSHVVLIWFVLDSENSRGETSVKANNIQRDNRVNICVDDQMLPFIFVTVFGTAKGGFKMGDKNSRTIYG